MNVLGRIFLNSRKDRREKRCIKTCVLNNIATYTRCSKIPRCLGKTERYLKTSKLKYRAKSKIIRKVSVPVFEAWRVFYVSSD